jgi:hypothetical protein
MNFQSLTESMKDYRKRVVEAMVQVPLNFQSAFRGSSPETQEQYKQDFQVWQEEHEKKAQDPGYVPQPLQPLEDELFSDHQVLQYISEITEGINEYYICRHLDCGMITRNSTWVQAKDREKYRCPSCTKEYKPWQERPGVPSQANKVMIVERPEKDPLFVLMVWPDTATTKLTDSLKITTHNLREELKGKDRQYVLDYVRNLDLTAPKPYFEKVMLTREAVEFFEDVNKASTKFHWDYKPLLDGYNGMRYKFNEGDIIYDQKDCIRMWGYTKWLCTTHGVKLTGKKEG